jgi:hypothetical protein
MKGWSLIWGALFKLTLKIFSKGKNMKTFQVKKSSNTKKTAITAHKNGPCRIFIAALAVPTIAFIVMQKERYPVQDVSFNAKKAC